MYSEWFKNDADNKKYSVEDIIKKYNNPEKQYFLMVCEFSCFSGIRDLFHHER